MPLSQCNKTYLDFNKNRNLPRFRDGISKGQYCAYDLNETEGGCRVGGGGSLQILSSNSFLPKVFAIVSFGIGNNCSDKYPQILTRVAYYIPWIEANVWPFDRSMNI